MKKDIHVAHSPDSDDAFMFYALATRKIDTGDLNYIHTLSDIETLNRKAMEGEFETPPILRSKFQYHPEARRGWDLMTALQRRNHLLGIFFAQTIQGRERRATKAIESCLVVARRKSQP